MKRLLAAALCLLAPALAGAGPWDETDRIIVTLREPADRKASALSAAKVDRLSNAAGARLKHFRAMSGDSQVLTLPGRMPLPAVRALIERLKKSGEIVDAEPDYRVRPALAPNDTLYAGSQWHYLDPVASGYAGAANLPSAWDVTTGAAGVTVAIIDTGKTSHSELNSRIVGGYDFISLDPDLAGVNPCDAAACTANDGNGRDSDASDPGDWITSSEDAGGDPTYGNFFQYCGVGDSSWHGTHVAGTIGAVTNNGASVAGVNWVSPLVTVRALGRCGGYNSDIIDAMRWAAGLSVSGVPANANPADVINMSLGHTGGCGGAEQAAVTEIVNAGVVIVAAAGNDAGNADTFGPAACTGVISVAAVRRDGRKAAYSNTGTTVKIAGPGGQTNPVHDTGVRSTLNTGTQGPVGETTGGYQGTSMATPHVAGVVSLMLSVDPTLTPAQVLSKLQSTARSFIALDTCNTSNCGAGILDANLAVRASVVLPSIPSISPATLGTSSITWTWTVNGTADSYNVYNAVTSASLSAGQPGLTYTRTGMSPNTLYSVRVHGVRATVEGGGTSSVSTATLPSGPVGVSVKPWISSATVSFTSCGANCSGYAFTLFSDAAMASAVGSAHDFNPAATSLWITGLSSLTTYYAKLGTINQVGGSSAVALGAIYTGTSLVAPSLQAPTGISASAMTINWSSNGNGIGTTYQVELSSVAGLGSGVQTQSGVDLFAATFTGLQANTSYYYRARSVGGFADNGGPASTYGVSPAGGSMVGSGVDGMSMSWSANGNAPNSAYLAELFSSANFTGLLASSATRNTSALITGLTANTTHYGRVTLLPNNAAYAPPAASLGASATPALPVVGPAFISAGTTALSGGWAAGGNPTPQTVFLAQVATDTTFGGVLVSSYTNNLTASFAGLTPGQRYYLRAAALNLSGVAAGFVTSASTYTLPVPPGTAAVALSSSTQSTLTVQWTQGQNGSGNQFTAQLGLNPGFTTLAGTSVTYNAYATFTGLATNTSYYLRVRTEGVGTNPDSAYVDAGYAGTTRPSLVTVTANPFQPVGYTVVGATWVARPAGPPSSSAEGYRLEVSTAMDFTGVIFSSAVPGSWSSTAAVSGLAFDTLYYARVASLNRDGAASYAHITFSTRTLLPRISSSAVTAGQALALAVEPPFDSFTNIRVDIPAGAFPQDTVITINASVSAELPSAFSSQGTLRPVGAGAGMSIDAGGAQPAAGKKVAIRMTYDPAELGTIDPATIRLFRYDEATRQWTLLQGAVDTQARLITGLTDHFSFFGAFAVTAGTGVDAVQIFPIPWTPSSGDGRFNAAELTFGNLPIEGEVRIFTLAGELLWSAKAGATGILTWDGRSRYGQSAGTGTYLVVIEKGGARVVKRVVVVR